MTLPLLSLLIFLPLIGALFICFIRREKSEVNARRVARFMSACHLGLSLWVCGIFEPLLSHIQLVEHASWLPFANSLYRLGVDGVSVVFLLLSSFLTSVLLIHIAPKERAREYFACILLMLSFLSGVFCAQDMFLFYFFFEATLVPMFLLIGIFGGVRRVYASFKFFLYTLFGSVFMLIALIVLYEIGHTTVLHDLTYVHVPLSTQYWLWAALFLAFAIKIPMFPVHTWLPDAHVEAPTAGSMLLAGILLKLGGYGMLRLLLPVLPEASLYFAPWVFWLSVIAIVYTSLIALVQKDIKKLVAYSSIAHMGFVTLGLFTFTEIGIDGSIVQMLSHGLISAALFFFVGVLYERFHTRDMDHYGGLASKMPKFAVFFGIFTMASIGVPGLSGFIGEFFVIMAIFPIAPLMAILATSGLILGAAYGLWLLRRILYDKLNTEFLEAKSMIDLRATEVLTLVFLLVPVLWIGLYPSALTSLFASYTRNLVDHTQNHKGVAPTTAYKKLLAVHSLAYKDSASLTKNEGRS